MLDIKFESFPVLFIHASIPELSLLFQEIHIMLQFGPRRHRHVGDISRVAHIFLLEPNFALVAILLLALVARLLPRPQLTNDTLSMRLKNGSNDLVEIMLLESKFGSLHGVAGRDDKLTD